MKYLSTRGNEKISFSEAIFNGIAPDGGLYVPEKFPYFSATQQNTLTTLNLATLGPEILRPWIQDDPLEPRLEEICQNAFHFETPLEWMNADTAVLELFHGPTAAFKDVGARFLAESLSHLPQTKNKVVLVATSGDTGGAVASAFFQKPGIQVVILYPKGKVSERQELQLTTWGDNIRAFSVRGHFDDCQRLVKAILLNPQLIQSKLSRTEETHPFLSANSINIGRLLPQSLYYAQSALNYFKKTSRSPGYIIPTGNLGNAVAALWAKKMGFPIREVVFATNANRPLVDYLTTGKWKPHSTIQTLANAMDVGSPNNIERLFHLYPEFTELQSDTQAYSVTDPEISRTITRGLRRWKQIFCPHTATAVAIREQLKTKDWIVVATAHPAKFETIVEPLIGKTLELPQSLQGIFSRLKQVTEIDASIEDLKVHLSYL
jgi:threonine synthase